MRRSSVYSVEVNLADGTFLDRMISRLPAGTDLSGSGVNAHGSVFIRVRLTSDADALEAALAACDGAEFTLATGYGVGRREVTSRPPAGCFCHLLEKPAACNTCTCPDCGSAGRFGISVVHAEGCRP